MHWFAKTLLIFLLPVSAFADAVHFENIFSTESFLGGVPCSANPTAEIAYSEPKTSSRIAAPQALTITCVQGGGDCRCYHLYSRALPTGGDKSFFEVRSFDNAGPGKPIWVSRETKTSLPMAALASETKNGEIHFRTPPPPAFLDEKLSQRFDLRDLSKIPDSFVKKILKEEPRPIAKLSITIPPDGSGQIEFRRHNPETPGRTFAGKALYKLAIGEFTAETKIGQPFIWDFVVYKKVGSSYLVGGPFREGANDFANVAEFQSKMQMFAWIETKGLGVQEEKLSNSVSSAGFMSEHPLAITIVQTVEQMKSIKNRSYTKLRVDLLMWDIGPGGTDDLNSVQQKAHTLREIWSPTHDEKNRINYWLTVVPGC